MRFIPTARLRKVQDRAQLASNLQPPGPLSSGDRYG